MIALERLDAVSYRVKNTDLMIRRMDGSSTESGRSEWWIEYNGRPIPEPNDFPTLAQARGDAEKIIFEALRDYFKEEETES